MNIVEASHKPTTIAAAVGYQQLGISVIALNGKKAIGSWQRYQNEVASAYEVAQWFKDQRLKRNVGIICGQVSGLVVIDLDGLVAIHRFEQRFPSLLRTFSVKTGSGVGKHYYYRLTTTPPTHRYTGRTGNVELRSNGCYVVAPPSVHPDTGNLYLPNTKDIMDVDNLDMVIDWINRLKANATAPTASATNTADNSVKAPTRWVQSALDKECEVVATAGEGNRNNALFLGACRMGTLVSNPDSGLSLQDAGNALYASAVRSGLVAENEAQVIKTIASGLKTGMKTPRKIG